MKELVFVVSDLHLGGKPGEGAAPGFQMCTPTARKRLAAFIKWVSEQAGPAQHARLVIAGDIVDFLAEEDPQAACGFSSFTADEHLAKQKLDRIFNRTAEVWDALANSAKQGVHLTLMLGNHDIELAMPALRRSLLARLGTTDVELLMDGEALSLGPVLIDHGNRSDVWNQIDHDTLRELRSELSRREPTARTVITPGSELVVRVMNRLKSTYGFVDLLKPETSAVLPLLVVLDPFNLATIEACAMIVAHKSRNAIDLHSKPMDSRKISAHVGAQAATSDSLSTVFDADTSSDLQLARELASGPASADSNESVAGRNIGAIDKAFGFADAWWASKASDRSHLLTRLLRALRRMNRHDQSFHVNREEDVYLDAANAAASRGYKVIVFGHTHLPKRIVLGGGATYLNTGSWADLIRLPTGLYADDAEALRLLDAFANDLATNEMGRWREQHPTFVRIELEAEKAEAELYRFWSSDRVERVSDGVLTRPTDD